MGAGQRAGPGERAIVFHANGALPQTREIALEGKAGMQGSAMVATADPPPPRYNCTTAFFVNNSNR